MILRLRHNYMLKQAFRYNKSRYHSRHEAIRNEFTRKGHWIRRLSAPPKRFGWTNTILAILEPVQTTGEKAAEMSEVRTEREIPEM